MATADSNSDDGNDDGNGSDGDVVEMMTMVMMMSIAGPSDHGSSNRSGREGQLCFSMPGMLGVLFRSFAL